MTTTLGETYAAPETHAADPVRVDDSARAALSGSRTHVRRSKRAVATLAAEHRAGRLAVVVMLGALAGVGLLAALLPVAGG
jgi:cob(I)alamin adenosyltransferase